MKVISMNAINRMMKPIAGAAPDDADVAAAEAAKAAAEAAAKAAAEAAAIEAAKAAADAAEAEKNKKKTPTDDEARLLKENMKRKDDLRIANEALEAAKLKLKDYEGIDPAAARKLLEDKKRAEENQLIAQGNWEKLKEQMNAHQAAELKERDDKIISIEQMNQGLTKQIADLTVGHAFSNSTYIKDELVLTPSKSRAVYGPHFEFKDGKVVGYDKPTSDPTRTMMVDGKGEPLPFEQAIKQLIESDSEHDHLLKSKIKPGAASSTDGGKKVIEKPELSGRSRIAAGLAQNAKK